MLNKRGALGQRALWILTSYQHDQIEPLTIGADRDGGFLPVFSFEEEADAFLELLGEEGKERGWRSRETTAGELVSVLLAPCADVRQVSLDPLPLSVGRAMLPLCSVARERFVEDLLMGSRRKLAGEELVSA
jgi:hypothetical protein